MLGIYFSGTGNTRHCVSKFVRLLEETAEIVPIEDPSVVEKIRGSDTIILGYPIQYSNAPYLVRDFIRSNSPLWKGKKVLCVATMGLFSGDGAGCTARLLKKRGAVILGGLHLRMPDSVCDDKRLKKSLAENREIVKAADQKIARTARDIKQGSYPRDGISLISRLAGLFGQRLWFYGKTAGYTDKLKISGTCVGCGKCAGLCPTGNIIMVSGRPRPDSRCTMCYRCISSCPQKAITLLGREVQEQCRFEKYITD